MKSLSLILCLILTIGYQTTAQAVTDAELEALEKQIEQQEVDEKKKAEQKRKLEAEEKHLAEEKTKRKAKVDQKLAEQEKQLQDEQKRLEAEKKKLEEEKRKVEETRLKSEAEANTKRKSEQKRTSAWASPLDEAGWHLVAHMSNSGGMFDGNGELQPTYSYGSFTSNPLANTQDFQRAFPVDAEEILFITGDFTIWAIAKYRELRTLIDAQGNDFKPNLAFKISVNGVESNAVGNVLSRRHNREDPWISMNGGHYDGINNQRIIWGENNWPEGAFWGGEHPALKNNHQGINVFVRAIH